MKHILQIAASLRIGGAEKVARDIGLFPDPEEYQNHYIVFGDQIEAYEKSLTEHGCKIFHMPLPSQGYGAFVRHLESLMAEYSYTAVHAHTMFNAGWVMYAAKKMHIPVRIAHAHSALDNKRGWKVSCYETLMRRMILSNATDLLACGEKAGIRLFGEKAFQERAQLILNGVDIATFRFNAEKRTAIRTELGMGNCFVIGHIGRFSREKNQGFLLSLMPDILQIRPNAKLLLLGDGEDRSMLEQKILSMSLQDNVIMTGNVFNVSDYLSAMDTFAFPSLFEGMPLSILEVQANGLPCVLSTGVPRDVYLTDLIHPLPLSAREEWIQAICGAERRKPEKYADILYNFGFDTKTAMQKIYALYERSV